MRPPTAAPSASAMHDGNSEHRFNMSAPTLCEDCDNVHSETRKRSPSQWLCVQFPRLSGQGFVAPNVWTEQEPFMKCIYINGGKCPVFKRRLPGQKELNMENN